MADTRRRNRIVIETPTARNQRRSHSAGRPQAGAREGIVALTLIGAAALATFMALFLTSRPYDPINSTLVPAQTVPAGSLAWQPSPKPSPTISPSPQQKQPTNVAPSPEPTAATATVPDDAAIQSGVERTLAAEPTLAKLDVSVLVERGTVIIVGSVRSADLKQRVEKAVRGVKGVVSVDNQLVITLATP